MSTCQERITRISSTCSRFSSNLGLKYDLFTPCLQFLNLVTTYSEQNKMTASNLAIVITPNVVRVWNMNIICHQFLTILLFTISKSPLHSFGSQKQSTTQWTSESERDWLPWWRWSLHNISGSSRWKHHMQTWFGIFDTPEKRKQIKVAFSVPHSLILIQHLQNDSVCEWGEGLPPTPLSCRPPSPTLSQVIVLD